MKMVTFSVAIVAALSAVFFVAVAAPATSYSTSRAEIYSEVTTQSGYNLGRYDVTTYRPASGDCDNDGKTETLFAMSDSNYRYSNAAYLRLFDYTNYVREDSLTNPAARTPGIMSVTERAPYIGAMQLVDVNGDSYLDILVSYALNATADRRLHWGIYYNRGSPGPYVSSTKLIQFQRVYQIERLCDVTADGLPDLVFFNFRYYYMYFYRNLGNMVFSHSLELLKLDYSTQYNAAGWAVGDLGTDGKNSIVFVSRDSYKLALWRTNGTNGFRPLFTVPIVLPEIPLNSGSHSDYLWVDTSSRWFAMTHANADVCNDLFILYQSPAVGFDVLWGNCTGGFVRSSPSPVVVTGLTDFRDWVIGDVNGDARADIVIASTFNAFRVFYSAAGVFSDGSAVTVNVPFRIQGLTKPFDANGDGFADLAFTSEFAVWLIRSADSAGSFNGPLVQLVHDPYTTFTNVHAADVDVDGRVDLLVYPCTGVMLNQGDGAFSGIVRFFTRSCRRMPSGGYLGEASVLDIDLDGRVEVVHYDNIYDGSYAISATSVVSGDATYSPTGWFNSTLSPVSPAVDARTNGTVAMALGDLDSDGAADDLIIFRGTPSPFGGYDYSTTGAPAFVVNGSLSWLQSAGAPGSFLDATPIVIDANPIALFPDYGNYALRDLCVRQMIITDIVGDGSPNDVLVLYRIFVYDGLGQSIQYTFGRLVFYRNVNNAGTVFSPPNYIAYSVGRANYYVDWLGYVAVGALNTTARAKPGVDIAVSLYDGRNTNVAILPNVYGNGSYFGFDPHADDDYFKLALGSKLPSLANTQIVIADFDGDSINDIVFSTYELAGYFSGPQRALATTPVSQLWQSGEGYNVWAPAHYALSPSVDAGVVNLIGTVPYGQACAILGKPYNVTDMFAPSAPVGTLNSRGKAMVVGDFDSDGFADIVLSTAATLVWARAEGGDFASASLRPLGPYLRAWGPADGTQTKLFPTSLRAGDMNGDGALDLVYLDIGPDGAEVGWIEAVTLVDSLDRLGPKVLSNRFATTQRTLFSSKSYTATGGGVLPFLCRQVDVLNVDMAGGLDILFASPRNYTVFVYFNDDIPLGTFARRKVFRLDAGYPIGWEMTPSLEVADVNGDDIYDVVWGTRKTFNEYNSPAYLNKLATSSVHLWLGERPTGQGSWGLNATDVLALGVPYAEDSADYLTLNVFSVAACDIDSDGDKDLVIVDPSGIAWRENTSPPGGVPLTFASEVATLYNGHDKPAKVRCVDLDRDGRMDLQSLARVRERRYSGSYDAARNAYNSRLLRNLGRSNNTLSHGKMLFDPVWRGTKPLNPMRIDYAVVEDFSVDYDFDGDGLADLAGLVGTTFELADYYVESFYGTLIELVSPLFYAPQFGLHMTVLPHTYTVDVVRCGYRLSCIADLVARASISGGDTIALPAGTYGDCFRGEPLRVPKSIRFVGAGSSQTIIDCSLPRSAQTPALGRYVMAISGGVQVSIVGLTIANAYTDEEQYGGGALRVLDPGTVLRLTDVRLFNCTANQKLEPSTRSPQLGFGAGILVDAGSLLATNCTFERNTARYGGAAISVLGSTAGMVLTRCVFESNVAFGTGGAIFIEVSTVVSSVRIEQCHFRRNIARGLAVNAGGDGGAFQATIYSGGLNLTIDGGSFAWNNASGSGGAVALNLVSASSLSFAMTGQTVWDSNAALSGSGGALSLALLGARTTLSCAIGGSPGVVFSNNRAALDGGGLAIWSSELSRSNGGSSATLSVTGLNLVSNWAARDGGGMMLSAAMFNGSMGGGAFSASGNTAGRVGGALCAAGLSNGLNFHDAAVLGNTALYGGGMAVVGDQDFLDAMPLDSDAESSSRIGEFAGAVPCSALGSMTATNVVFATGVSGPGSSNSAPGGHGRALFLCGTRLSLVACAGLPPGGASAGFDFGDVPPTSGGFAFVCLPATAQYPLECLASAAPSCCAASASPLVPGFEVPWLSADAATAANLAGWAGTSGRTTAGYGPIVSSPVARLDLLGTLSGVIPTGFALKSRGTVKVAAFDAFSQAVADGALSAQLVLQIPGLVGASSIAAAAALFEVVDGAGSRPTLGSGTVSFDTVAVAARTVAGIDAPLSLLLQLSDSAVLASGASTRALSVSLLVNLTICPPGAGIIETSLARYLQCASCPLKTFSNSTGLHPCGSCSDNSFNPSTGATRCLSCPLGTVATAFFQDSFGAPDVNCSCDRGFWQPEQRDGLACLPCPEGAICEGRLALPYARPGYYPTSSPGLFLACPNSAACAGGTPFRCTSQYTGRLCALCRRGYYALNLRCYKCNGSQTYPLILLVLLAVFALAALLTWMNVATDINFRFAAVIIGFTSLQISALYGSLELAWPAFTRRFFAVVSFLNFNLEVSSPECAATIGDIWLVKFILTLLLPFLFCVPFAAVFLAWMARIKLCGARWPTAIMPRALLDAMKRGYVQLITLLFMPLCSMALSFFRCKRIKDGTYVLEASPSRQCYNAAYWSLFPVALIFALIYCVGIPTVVAAALTWLRARAVQAGELYLFEVRYAFLTGRYRREQYRYEAWLMVFKCGVILAMSVGASQNDKAYVTVCVLALLISQLLYVKPFADIRHNQMAGVCFASCAIVLWAATFTSSSARFAGCVAGLTINIAAILIGNAYDGWVVATRAREAEAEFEKADDTGEVLADDNLSLFRADTRLGVNNSQSDEMEMGALHSPMVSMLAPLHSPLVNPMFASSTDSVAALSTPPTSISYATPHASSFVASRDGQPQGVPQGQPQFSSQADLGSVAAGGAYGDAGLFNTTANFEPLHAAMPPSSNEGF